MINKTFTSKEIEEDLITKIEAKIYEPNKKLPTERELMEIYGVSRMTVRNVINNLISKDVAYRISGRGAFVQKDFISKSNVIKSYTQMMKELGKTPSSKLLGFQTIIPNEFTRLSLGLEEGQAAFEIRRLRYADGIPMCVSTTCFPTHLFPDFADIYTEDKSTYNIIVNHYNVELSYMKRTISAVKLDPQTAEFLYGKKSGFSLKMEGVVYDKNNIPIQYGISYYNADEFSLVSVNQNK